MLFPLGRDAKIYIRSAIYSNTPTGTLTANQWTEVTNVQNGTMGLTWAKTTTTSRSSGPIGNEQKVTANTPVSFTISRDPADASYTLLRSAAYSASTEIALACLSGPIGQAGIDGVVGNFQIDGFSRDEGGGSHQTVNVTATPSSYCSFYAP